MESKEAFSEQIIDENQPAISRDFEIFLNFVAENNLQASGKMELLPLKSLPELNALLTKPFDIALKRPVQKSFANINGLYLLARTSGLLILQKSGKNSHFAIDEEALKSWQSLNPTERYFTLIETWVVRSSVETIGERDDIFTSPLFSLVRLFEDIDANGENVKKNKRFQEDGFLLYGSYNIALAEMFGWVEIKHGKGQKGKGWIVEQLELTNFGMECIVLLQENLKDFRSSWIDSYLEDEEDQTDIDENIFNFLQPAFQTYFPDWKNAYCLPQTETKDGIFVFKVSLGKDIWRRIAIDSNELLDDLHDIIQVAFDLDDDHLYQFTFRNRFGIKQRVPHPMCEEEFSTDEFEIRQLPLRIGETMEYIFDFGDWWQFTIELEDIKPHDPKYKNAEILEEQGESPEQYPDWDDDDEW